MATIGRRKVPDCCFLPVKRCRRVHLRVRNGSSVRGWVKPNVLLDKLHVDMINKNIHVIILCVWSYSLQFLACLLPLSFKDLNTTSTNIFYLSQYLYFYGTLRSLTSSQFFSVSVNSFVLVALSGAG